MNEAERTKLITRVRSEPWQNHICNELFDAFISGLFILKEPDSLDCKIQLRCRSKIFKTYQLEISHETLEKLLRLTRNNPAKFHIFCYPCSYFNLSTLHFVTVFHLKESSSILGGLIFCTWNNWKISRILKWHIRSMWFQDILQTLYYFAWFPEEVLEAILLLV